MSDHAPRIAGLADTAIIGVTGADARTFLHAQLSGNIADLSPDEAPLGAWHDPRGRVRALFRVLPAGEQWWLLTCADIATAVLRKLQMFVLRARVTLAPADDLHVHALIGDADGWLEAAQLDLAAKPNALHHARDVYWLRVGPKLIYAVGADAAIRAACAGLEPAPADAAELAAIRCGIPRIDAALTEKYIPQMLNLDALGAVSFNKGCYPGQEVITRTQHRGTVKRRMRRFAAASGAVPAIGAALASANGEPAGEVVRAARAEHGAELLAVVRLDSLGGPLFAAGNENPLTELPLPYG
jgi:tRNA-modifying protein YgfZ